MFDHNVNKIHGMCGATQVYSQYQAPLSAACGLSSSQAELRAAPPSPPRELEDIASVLSECLKHALDLSHRSESLAGRLLGVEPSTAAVDGAGESIGDVGVLRNLCHALGHQLNSIGYQRNLRLEVEVNRLQYELDHLADHARLRPRSEWTEEDGAVLWHGPCVYPMVGLRSWVESKICLESDREKLQWQRLPPVPK
jgi:hypothetical protein